MTTLAFVVSTIAIGLISSAPGLLVGKYLISKGVVRNLDAPWVISAGIVALFLLRLRWPQIDVSSVAILFSMFSPAYYRNDIWTAFRRGRWWWQSQSDARAPNRDQFTVGVIVVYCVWLLMAMIITLVTMFHQRS